MKAWNKLLCIGICLCLSWNNSYATTNFDSLSYEVIVKEMKSDLAVLKNNYWVKVNHLELKFNAVDAILKNPKSSDRQLLNAWQQRMDLKTEITRVERGLQIGLDKVRYRKGLELIKLMYEKILGLDHHFHSLQTYQNVMQLSNPNAYPEFQATKDVLNERLKKKSSVKLPSLLDSNPFLSASFSLVASVLGDGTPKEKEEDLDKIACILDFTVRMNADLNTIYYETEFLKESNTSLKEECNRLFRDYCKIIGYRIPLDDCRQDDDWETVYDLLDDYIENLQGLNSDSVNAISASRKFSRGIANLEFSIDRLLDFLDSYSDFINQGEKYYQKFQVIVSNYQNEEQCTDALPHQFTTLKQDIKYSIEKFKDAYFVAELKGSKLKDLLYGEE